VQEPELGVVSQEQERLRAEAPPILVEVAPSPLLRLDLGCGHRPRDGFEGVDLHSPSAKHKVDLFRFPFPWADRSVEALLSSHFIEHLPARDVEERDLVLEGSGHREIRQEFIGKDFLYAFMDECHRILAPGGTFLVIVPNQSWDGAYQDPTHRRFLNQNTFLYFNRTQREQMGVDLYSRASCDFMISQMTPVGPEDFALRAAEVQERAFKHYRNTVYEWHITLQKKSE
jgi:SAM-dependent methyltransferase